jgi:hypothetical protein
MNSVGPDLVALGADDAALGADDAALGADPAALAGDDAELEPVDPAPEPEHPAIVTTARSATIDRRLPRISTAHPPRRKHGPCSPLPERAVRPYGADAIGKEPTHP